MQVRQLGNGPTVSVLGLGCNNFGMKIDAEQTNEVVGAALDAGITHFDTAEMYGDGLSEEFLGRALGSRRDEVVVATKFLPRPAEEPYTPGALAARIRSGCEQSLRRLGTDRIDLYYQHYPDPQAPAEEALETLASLVAEGKVVHIASSNVTAEQLVSDQQTAAQRDLPAFCGTQIEWNLLNRQVEESIVPAAVSAGMGVVPYYPLASVLLTGKYHRGQAFPKGSRFDELPFFSQIATDDNLARVDRLAAFADDRGHTLLELAIAWLLAQAPVASVIAGATSAEQVATNAASTTWKLTEADLQQLEFLN